MIRNAKVLGLALVASFALSAVVASTASAFTEETKPGLFTFGLSNDNETAKIDTEQIKEGTDTFTINGLTVTCKIAIATGNAIKTKASPEEDVANGSQPGTQSTDITVEPLYAGCHVVIAGVTKTATITTHECAYIYDAKTTVTEVGFDRTALMSIECPLGEQIEIHIYNEKEGEASVLCTYDVKSQNTLAGTTLDNLVNTPTAGNDVRATVNVSNITVINTDLSALCGEKEATTAVYKGETTIRATNAAGSFIDASVSD